MEARLGRQRIDEERKIDQPRTNQSKRAIGENPKISVLRKRKEKCKKCNNDKFIKYEYTGGTKCTKCGNKTGR